MVIGVSVVAVIDTMDEPLAYVIWDQLSDDAKPFLVYADIHHMDGMVPRFKVPLRYSDGTETMIEFGLLEMGTLDYLESYFDEVAEREGKVLSEFGKSRFLEEVTIRNNLAKAALAEYESGAQDTIEADRDSRRTIIAVAATLIVVPSSVLLILGYRVAWVRRRFRNQ